MLCKLWILQCRLEKEKQQLMQQIEKRPRSLALLSLHRCNLSQLQTKPFATTGSVCKSRESNPRARNEHYLTSSSFSLKRSQATQAIHPSDWNFIAASEE
eukprot:4378821-Amphidinium_carterae.1